MRGASAFGMKGETQHVEGLAEQMRRNACRAAASTMRLAETRFQCRSIASAGLGSCALSTRSIAARADFSAGSSSERCGNAGAYPAATSNTLRSRKGTSQPLRQLQHHLARRRRAAGLHEAQMTRGNLGVAGEIELAEMAALPPFAQVIADMGGLGSFGSCRGGVCVHGGKPTMRNRQLPLPRDVIELPRRRCHLRRHRRRSRPPLTRKGEPP